MLHFQPGSQKTTGGLEAENTSIFRLGIRSHDFYPAFKESSDFQESERTTGRSVLNEPNCAVPLRTMVFTMVFPWGFTIIQKDFADFQGVEMLRLLLLENSLHGSPMSPISRWGKWFGTDVFEPESKSSKTETNKRTTQSTSHFDVGIHISYSRYTSQKKTSKQQQQQQPDCVHTPPQKKKKLGSRTLTSRSTFRRHSSTSPGFRVVIFLSLSDLSQKLPLFDL